MTVSLGAATYMLPLSYVLFTQMPMPPLAENSWLPMFEGVASVSSAHLRQEDKKQAHGHYFA